MVADANRRGYAQLLDGFWDEARKSDLALPADEPVSGPAFCKARRKISPAVMRTLGHRAADAFVCRFRETCTRSGGRRFLGIDGTKINVQRSPELAEACGVPNGAYCPQILVSTLFDLEALVPHDVVIGPYQDSEREHLVQLLDRVHPGDVLVLDRGYPSFEVLRILLDAGIDFVIRVRTHNTFGPVADFLARKGRDHRIVISPRADGPLSSADPVEVRAVRTDHPSDGPTVLLTSITKAEMNRACIAAIYRKRWEIEEFYKTVKSHYIGQGQFHSKTMTGVQQEIYTVALFVGITRYLMAAAADTEKVDYRDLSAKSGILGLADNVIQLLLSADDDSVLMVLDRLLPRIVHTRYLRRPGRSFPRRSFIPRRKWGPRGRDGG